MKTLNFDVWSRVSDAIGDRIEGIVCNSVYLYVIRPLAIFMCNLWDILAGDEGGIGCGGGDSLRNQSDRACSSHWGSSVPDIDSFLEPILTVLAGIVNVVMTVGGGVVL